MLIRFQVANHRSIAEPVELSMVAVDESRDVVRHFPTIGVGLTPLAGVFGANASGKTNLLNALSWLVNAVHRFPEWGPEIPTAPFKFTKQPDPVTRFELELEVDGVRCEYLLDVEATQIVYEALFDYPMSGRRCVFEREGARVRAGAETGIDLDEVQASLQLTPNVPVLSLGRQLSLARYAGDPPASERTVLERFVDQLFYIDDDNLGVERGPLGTPAEATGSPPRLAHWSTIKLLDESPKRVLNPRATANDSSMSPADAAALKRKVLAMLRWADPTIVDALIDWQMHRAGTPEEYAYQRVRLVHAARETQSGDGRVVIDFADEAQGTRTWFAMIWPVLDALHSGRVLLIDELDASLHPRLCASLLRAFSDPRTNPNGGQLVFTSHDPSLLSYLNRDEIWFAEKSDDGATHLVALAEYDHEDVVESKNIESRYLQGQFGGVPELDGFDVLSVLGLVS